PTGHRPRPGSRACPQRQGHPAGFHFFLLTSTFGAAWLTLPPFARKRVGRLPALTLSHPPRTYGGRDEGRTAEGASLAGETRRRVGVRIRGGDGAGPTTHQE